MTIVEVPQRLMFQISQLDPPCAQFAGMTFPAFRDLLRSKKTEQERANLFPNEEGARPVTPLVIGATLAGRPIGLALGVLPIENSEPQLVTPRRSAELLSLFVATEARRQGIGRRLMSEFERLADQHGASAIEASYSTGKPGAEFFERMALDSGWTGPTPRMRCVRFTIAEATTTLWYKKYRQRKALEVFPWAELREDEVQRLRATQESTAWIPEDLVPWKYDRRGFDTISSVGARLKGEIVGWVINHRVGNTVRFTCSFIRDDLRRRGRILPLYSEAISRLAERPEQKCSLTVPMHHPDMVGFIDRHCASWVSFVGETRGVVKPLLQELRQSESDLEEAV